MGVLVLKLDATQKTTHDQNGGGFAKIFGVSIHYVV
jgi:hypothetical protein